MSSRLNPYLTFEGTAAQAMELYRSVFGGTLDTSTYGQFGAPDGVDPDGVMHAQLDTPSGFCLMASDAPPGMPTSAGTGVSICLSGDDGPQLRGWFERLCEGGTVSTPLERQVWGDEYGECTDRFGVVWRVDITQPADRGAGAADVANAAGAAVSRP